MSGKFLWKGKKRRLERRERGTHALVLTALNRVSECTHTYILPFQSIC